MSAATFITWSSANSFCRELTSLERKSGLISASVRYSLPTEAQWEYACRAGTTTRFSFGDAVSSLNEYAWWGYEVARGNCSDAPYVHNVAALKPNPWGLYDIHGNAWEWCSDWYGDSLPGGIDPQGVGNGTRRILRGGHWSFDETFCRSGDRSGSEPEYLNHSFGFRVVRVEDRVDDETQQQAVSRLPSKTNSIGMTLVEIPAGTFVMGSHCGQPNYTVQISRPFLMGATEVTNEQWLRVMGNVPSEWRDPDRPVENVSWADAVTFCRQLMTLPEERVAGMVYRLPTEAEWEYACRAGTTTRHWFGNDDSLVGNYAWLYLNARGTTHPVGQKNPNPWGLYDMRGNVWEWCSDWSDVTSHTSNELVIDPQGPTYSAESKRVVRGGSLGDNPDSFCSESPPETRSRGIGFRVVGVLEHVASP
jgi:formylglycine-generating enzyme required for sulfatase activity